MFFSPALLKFNTMPGKPVAETNRATVLSPVFIPEFLTSCVSDFHFFTFLIRAICEVCG